MEDMHAIALKLNNLHQFYCFEFPIYKCGLFYHIHLINLIWMQHANNINITSNRDIVKE